MFEICAAESYMYLQSTLSEGHSSIGTVLCVTEVHNWLAVTFHT